MDDDIVYATATLADIPGIQFTAEEAWRAAYRGIFADSFITSFLSRAYSTETLRLAIESDRSTFLVAKEDGVAVVGYCQFGPDLTEDGVELYRLYIDPDYQRSGIGGHLLDMVEDQLRRDKIIEYYCYVHAENQIAKAFYFKHGFSHDASRDRADLNGEWCMVKRLG
jgi:ribosomal protein S18 acetylase RimI-like enzyme